MVSAARGDNSAQSLRASWQFDSAVCSRWLRLTTYSVYGEPSPHLPNPVIACSKPLTLRVLLLPRAAADLDLDSDVDGDDFDVFNACLTGPALPYAAGLPAGCTQLPDQQGFLDADFDRDGDVDQDDFGEFQAQLTGPG